MSPRDSFRGWAFWALAAMFVLMSTAVAQDAATPKAEIFGGYAWADPNVKLGTAKIGSIPKGFAVSGTIKAR